MSSVRHWSSAHVRASFLAAAALGAIAQQAVPTPRVTVSCSVARPGTASAQVRWPTAAAPVAGSRLDVTIYRNGFSRGTYAYFRPRGTTRIAGGQQRLTRLVSDSSPPRDDSLPAYRLTGVQVVSSADTAVITIDGLEDGINYYWRIAVSRGQQFAPGEVARVSAPTCPGRERIGRD